MKKKLLVIGWVWPEPTSSAAGVRMMQLLQAFIAGGFDILFVSASKPGPHKADLGDLGVSERLIELNSNSFNQLIQEIQPDVVVYDRFMTEEQFGWRVSQECPHALTILDTEDLHFLRRARKEALRSNTGCPACMHNEITRREIASILRCDLSLIISTYEKQLLQDTFKIDPGILWYIPYMENSLSADDIAGLPAYEARSNFSFIGNFLHAPNVDAAERLKHEFWPQIRKQIPHAELHIYGAYPNQRIQELNQPDEGFIIRGRAEDSRLTLAAYRVLLAPIRFGAGIKGKFIDAIHSGTPSVTTSLGAEAIAGPGAWPGSISDDPSEFIQRSVALYQDKQLWFEAVCSGMAVNNANFSRSLHETAFLEKINELLVQVDKHRRTHYLGEIMRADLQNSKKYMSLWIQEKENRRSHS